MKKICLFFVISVILPIGAESQHTEVSASGILDEMIENPVTSEWIRNNLKKDPPRLFLKVS